MCTSRSGMLHMLQPQRADEVLRSRAPPDPSVISRRACHGVARYSALCVDMVGRCGGFSAMCPLASCTLGR